MNKIKTKSEHIPRPRPFLYKAKIEKHGTRAHNSENEHRCSENEQKIEAGSEKSKKAHKKVQNRKNRRKGVFWAVNFQKVKSIDRGLPSRIWAYFG